MKSLARKGRLTHGIRQDLNLLLRHVIVLRTVEKHEPIGIVRLSEVLGLVQHKVRYSLHVLEEEGLVKPSQQGAITTKRVREFHKELRVILGELKRAIETLGNLSDDDPRSKLRRRL